MNRTTIGTTGLASAEANVRGLSRRLPGSSSLVLAVVNSAVALTVDKLSCELVVGQP